MTVSSGRAQATPGPAAPSLLIGPTTIAFAAALLYLAAAACFPWSKPGLHYDEALFVRDTVQMLRTNAMPTFPHEWRSWMRFPGRSLPVMDLPYAGPIKAYLMVFPFAFFGTGAAVCRAAAVLLSAFGIGAMTWMVGREISTGTAAGVGVLLAVHPAILDQTIYDNSIVAVWLATLGLCCIALSAFLRTPSAKSGFLLGAAVGFATWGRLNFLWLAGAAAISAAIFAPAAARIGRHAGSLAAGLAAGSAPLLLYEIATRVSTLRYVRSVDATGTAIGRAAARLPELAETLLSDGEHRAIWGGPRLPPWQTAFAATLASVTVAAALLARRKASESAAAAAWRRASALTTVIFAATMLLSGLNVVEHHLVTLVPVAALAAVLGARRLPPGRAASRSILAAAAALFAGLCVVWNVRAAAGIRRTGGIGQWSDAVDDVTATLRKEAPGDTARALTWGLANNVFVLTGGAVAPREAFWTATETVSDRGKPWPEEIRDGGFFLIGTIPSAAATGFRRALDASGARFRKWTFRQRDGVPYAELIRLGDPPKRR